MDQTELDFINYLLRENITGYIVGGVSGFVLAMVEGGGFFKRTLGKLSKLERCGQFGVITGLTDVVDLITKRSQGIYTTIDDPGVFLGLATGYTFGRFLIDLKKARNGLSKNAEA